jgi:hypothetical protein
VTYVKVISGHVTGRTEEKHENALRMVDVLVEV